MDGWKKGGKVWEGGKETVSQMSKSAIVLILLPAVDRYSKLLCFEDEAIQIIQTTL